MSEDLFLSVKHLFFAVKSAATASRTLAIAGGVSNQQNFGKGSAVADRGGGGQSFDSDQRAVVARRHFILFHIAYGVARRGVQAPL
jgi:hypothetical protein